MGDDRCLGEIANSLAVMEAKVHRMFDVGLSQLVATDEALQRFVSKHPDFLVDLAPYRRKVAAVIDLFLVPRTIDNLTTALVAQSKLFAESLNPLAIVLANEDPPEDAP